MKEGRIRVVAPFFPRFKNRIFEGRAEGLANQKQTQRNPSLVQIRQGVRRGDSYLRGTV